MLLVLIVLDDDIVDTLDFTKSDCIFVDLNGNQENYTTSIEPYALCTHSMVDGTFYTHAKNSSGGCTVKSIYMPAL